MALDPRSESSDLERMRRGGGSSRLAALQRLRSACADVETRLGRPPGSLSHRYRDLILVTRLVQLELDHLAGRTMPALAARAAPASNGHGSPNGDGPGNETEAGWAHHWGLTTRLELHTKLKRYSVKREWLGRLLTRGTRARAAEAAERKYEAIALSIPWQQERAASPVTSKRSPSFTLAIRRRLVIAAGRAKRLPKALLPAAAAAVLALAVMFDDPDRLALDPGAGIAPEASIEPATLPPPSFGPLHAAPAESRSERNNDAGRRDHQPERSGGNRAPNGAEGDGDTAPVLAEADAPAPEPAPTPAPPAPVPAPAPPPAPAPAPEPPPSNPPEFGFEN